MPRQTEFPLVRDRAWGIWGELILLRQIENETLRLSQSGLLFCTSVEANFAAQVFR